MSAGAEQRLHALLSQYAQALPAGGFVVAGCTIDAASMSPSIKLGIENCSAADLAMIALHILDEVRDLLIPDAADPDARVLLLAADRAGAALSFIRKQEGRRQ